MSGFVAVVARDGAPVPTALVDRLLATEVGWGCDGVATWSEGPVALGHALVTTRTGATLGPHHSPRGTRLAGDIRLDDRDTLIARLRAAGADASPLDRENDDALVLAAYDQWGERALEQLHGDFAFALWDPQARRLLVARDPLGVRPLFYAETGAGFVCASAVDAVRAHPAVRDALHAPAILSFVQWGFNVDPATTSFVDIARLPAASSLTVDAEGRAARPRRYWEFPVPALRARTGESELFAEYRQIVADATADRMRLPRVGLQLSGGVDSTSLAVAMRDRGGAAAVDAQTWDGSHLAPDDEGRLAALVAAHLGIAHEVRNDSPRYLGFLDDPTRRTPEPHDNPEHDQLWASSVAMAQRTPVVIVGEDGDALHDPPGLLTMWRTLPRMETLAAIIDYRRRYGRRPHLGFWLRRRWRDLWTSPVPPLPSSVRADLRATIGEQLLPASPAHPLRPESHASLAAVTWQSQHEATTPAHLGARLEHRWPFLDERVIRFVWSVPPVPWAQRKALARQAYAPFLPPEIAMRPKTPYRYSPPWSSRPFARRTFAPALADFIAIDALRDSLEQDDTSYGISRVLQLDHWLQGR